MSSCLYGSQQQNVTVHVGETHQMCGVFMHAAVLQKKEKVSICLQAVQQQGTAVAPECSVRISCLLPPNGETL
eukprot:1154062-Pelagomonas_calceolata.AAC.1